MCANFNKTLVPKQPKSGWNKLLVQPTRPLAQINPSYRILIRSFIAAPSVGFGPSTFFGDSRKPTAETNSTVHFRAIQEFAVSLNRGSSALRLYEQVSSATIGIVAMPTLNGVVPLMVRDNARTHHSLSIVRRVRSERGKGITNSFETTYWAKDPITPQQFTPALDIQSKFSLTIYESSGLMRLKAKITGDLFPSVEVVLINPATGGQNILLGAHMEKGGLADLFMDNRQQLIDVDVDLILDKNGGFTGVRSGGSTYFIRLWNERIIRQAMQR
jgi:hypothetical protein